MAAEVSSVLLDRAADLPAEAILRELQARYPELSPVLDDASGQIRTFTLSIGELIVADMGGALPWSDLEGPCATSILWRDAADVLKGHSSHLVVTLLTQAEGVPASEQLSKVTTAVLAGCDHAMGVFWLNASLLVPKPLFVEMCEQLLPKGPPIHIWIDFRVGRVDDRHTAGFTQGMSALGLMELETQNCPEPVGSLRERLQNLALYLIENGLVIGDGHSFGYSESEQIHVVHGSSAFGTEGAVMQLHFDPTAAPRAGKKKWFWQR